MRQIYSQSCKQMIRQFLRLPLQQHLDSGNYGFLAHRTLSSSSSSSASSSSAASQVRDLSLEEDRIYNMDFKTATEILFQEPPRKKKFGLDFHLVQLFFACMPSLAVYLVAQYARYEIRRMEAEVELKKKQEEEKKAKEMESQATEKDSDSELLQVKTRLEALEETVKEIVDETRKASHTNQNIERETSKLAPTDPSIKVDETMKSSSANQTIERETSKLVPTDSGSNSSESSTKKTQS
ncbi:hypothetical protein AMTRI_Chr05g65240 [Amborella trichopoda]